MVGLPSTIIADHFFERNNTFSDWCNERHITTYFSPPYAHQVNGLVERSHGLLWDRLRTSLADVPSNTSQSAFTSIFRHALMSLNRRPMPDLSNLSPSEILFGFVPRDQLSLHSDQAKLSSRQADDISNPDITLRLAFLADSREEALTALQAAQKGVPLANRVHHSRLRPFVTASDQLFNPIDSAEDAEDTSPLSIAVAELL
ncbi:uncharacterized protein MEPE_02718 [Melanopsichium pennsylvanicum]|uniref:Integrase catalytic domain-containing protein n=1 Tax=Melanopsichium pennsylvanicum TaxID=63383 RepID=A0AAJ4XKW0_9BASI|nr:uncharacterized protein MEPE_02718 [Melanopsichium pennsylvanicum]